MPNKLFDYADPEHPLLRGPPGPETGAGLGGEVGSGNAYDALMGYVRRVMATDPAAVQQALRDQAAAERQRSVDMGYADPVTGLPTAKGAADIAGQWGRGVMMGTTAPGEAPGITAYHGSPHSFDRFDLGKIGTGEGAQAYGHGLYFAEKEGTARSYRDTLSGNVPTGPATHWMARAGGDPKKALDMFNEWTAALGEPETAAQQDIRAALGRAADPAGHMYEVNIAADPEHFLHWDKPLSEQSPYVQERLKGMDLPTDRPMTYGEMKPHIAAMRDALSDNGLLSANAEHILTGHNWDQSAIRESLSPDKRIAFDAALNDYNRATSATGGDLYHSLTGTYPGGIGGVAGGPRNSADVAETLRDAGIPGIRYYDAGSRAAGEGSHNYVVFDADTLDILRKYGIAGLGIGGAAAGNALDQGSNNAQ